MKNWARAAILAMLVSGAGSLAASGSLPENPVSTEFGEIPLPHVVPAFPDSGDASFGPPDSLQPPPAPGLPLPNVLPFGPGELLEFSIDYGIINAGGATMEIGEVRRISGRPCFDIRTEARSNSVFSKVYKVWDRSQTFLDTQDLVPWRYEKHQREGTYKKDMLIKFDRVRHVASYENGDQVKIHPYAQDELSAFYYLRAVPLEVGRDVYVDTHTNRKNYPLKVLVHRRETITVPAGTFDCYVIEPVMREGGIFTAKGKLTVWITADEKRMPVLLRTKIVVGSISATLVKYREGERATRIAGTARS
jgi:hypothetical protein